MAGHSKWANTKHRKALQDAKRGKTFTKIIRELVTATRVGGDNPTTNPRLRAAVDKALYSNMNRNTLNRAIARGGKSDGGINTENIIYEGYGPGGIAVMVECISDNRNRTLSKVRYVFNKCGGNLSTNGSVAYLFSKKGILSFKEEDETFITEKSLEAGAEDIIVHSNGKIDVHIAWEKTNFIRNILEKFGLKAYNTEISMIPFTKVRINKETVPRLLRLINMLKDCDDVQKVHHNGEIFNMFAETLQ